MVIIGSFMSWIETPIGDLNGSAGPGLWTFYAAMIGLAGALIPRRIPMAVQGALFGVVSLALPIAQVYRFYDRVGFGGWQPGPGVVLVIGGGVLALVASHRVWRADLGR